MAVLAFDDFEVDLELFQLRRSGTVVDLVRKNLVRKSFDVLVYLIRHRERVVSKDELLQSV